jgi:hypothetical protein
MTSKTVYISWASEHLHNLREAVAQVKQDCPNQGYEPVKHSACIRDAFGMRKDVLSTTCFFAILQVVKLLEEKNNIVASISAVQSAVRRHFPSELKYLNIRTNLK